jgi:hypothetical protein
MRSDGLVTTRTQPGAATEDTGPHDYPVPGQDVPGHDLPGGLSHLPDLAGWWGTPAAMKACSCGDKP